MSKFLVESLGFVSVRDNLCVLSRKCIIEMKNSQGKKASPSIVWTSSVVHLSENDKKAHIKKLIDNLILSVCSNSQFFPFLASSFFSIFFFSLLFTVRITVLLSGFFMVRPTTEPPLKYVGCNTQRRKRFLWRVYLRRQIAPQQKLPHSF